MRLAAEIGAATLLLTLVIAVTALSCVREPSHASMCVCTTVAHVIPAAGSVVQGELMPVPAAALIIAAFAALLSLAVVRDALRRVADGRASPAELQRFRF